MGVAKEILYYGKTLYAQTGGTYTMQGDYCLPNLYHPKKNAPSACRRIAAGQYLKQHHKILYCNLLTSGKLRFHLTDVEAEAQSFFLRRGKEYVEQEGVTKQLKAENPTERVQKMNNIRNRVAESVCTDLIFAYQQKKRERN